MSFSDRHAAVAESILRLVAAPDDAAAIVGDIAEINSTGRAQFWCDVLSSGGALLIHSVRRHPLSAICLGVAGFVLWSLIYVAVRVAFAFAGLVPIDTSFANCAVLSLGSFALLAIALVSSNLLAGVAIGYRSRDGAMNRCVPLALLFGLGMIAFPLAASMRVEISWYCLGLYLVGLPLLYILPLLCGGAIGGRLSAGHRAAR